jgi:hypothetical protein
MTVVCHRDKRLGPETTLIGMSLTQDPKALLKSLCMHWSIDDQGGVATDDLHDRDGGERYESNNRRTDCEESQPKTDLWKPAHAYLTPRALRRS